LAATSDGLPSSPISRNSRTNFSVPKWRCTSGVSAENCATLPPELKTFSCVEVSTTQRTASSVRAASNAAIRSLSIASESELRVSGSSSAIVATGPSTL
jgi:hypothetical protein